MSFFVGSPSSSSDARAPTPNCVEWAVRTSRIPFQKRTGLPDGLGYLSNINRSVEELELGAVCRGLMLGHLTSREKNYSGPARREYGSIVLDPQG